MQINGKLWVLLIAIVLHGLLAAWLFGHVMWPAKPPVPKPPAAIQADMVSAEQARQAKQAAALKARQLAAQKRQEAEAAAQRAVAEQARQPAEQKRQEAEAWRVAEAAKRREAEEAAQKRLAAEKLLREHELQAQYRAARMSTEVARISQLIQQKVARYWRRSPGLEGLSCRIKVRLVRYYR